AFPKLRKSLFDIYFFRLYLNASWCTKFSTIYSTGTITLAAMASSDNSFTYQVHTRETIRASLFLLDTYCRQSHNTNYGTVELHDGSMQDVHFHHADQARTYLSDPAQHWPLISKLESPIGTTFQAIVQLACRLLYDQIRGGDIVHGQHCYLLFYVRPVPVFRHEDMEFCRDGLVHNDEGLGLKQLNTADCVLKESLSLRLFEETIKDIDQKCAEFEKEDIFSKCEPPEHFDVQSKVQVEIEDDFQEYEDTDEVDLDEINQRLQELIIQGSEALKSEASISDEELSMIQYTPSATSTTPSIGFSSVNSSEFREYRYQP
ncbi:hypothetical protein P154DRAFT_607188, partial [Amniculicola lignicola CBS 123094]